MAQLKDYLEKVYQERMEGGAPTPTTSSKELTKGQGLSGTLVSTYDLELAGNIIKGHINNEKISLNLNEFATKYKDIAGEILTILKKDGVARYSPDKQPPSDFVKNPRTKNQLQATPDN